MMAGSFLPKSDINYASNSKIIFLSPRGYDKELPIRFKVGIHLKCTYTGCFKNYFYSGLNVTLDAGYHMNKLYAKYLPFVIFQQGAEMYGVFDSTRNYNFVGSFPDDRDGLAIKLMAEGDDIVVFEPVSKTVCCLKINKEVRKQRGSLAGYICKVLMALNDVVKKCLLEITRQKDLVEAKRLGWDDWMKDLDYDLLTPTNTNNDDDHSEHEDSD